MMKRDLKYLQLLAKSFPTIQAASTEIINLEAILNLPKGTEHFITDLHGEYEAVNHVLRNASGVIRRKVEEVFGHTLRESEKTELCTLIYYPEGKLKVVKHKEKDKELDEWYKVILMRLVQVCAAVSSKYTRSKVRKAMPPEYEYIIQELLHESKGAEANKHDYIAAIVKTIITTGRADHFIIALCNLIQRLTIDSLHIIGDIYDRGPGAHIIMDTLSTYHNWDIQWGNHDLVWMGAAAGSQACVANVLRMCFRYANFKILEEGYGINLMPLVTFAMDVYGDDPCTIFRPKGVDAETLNPKQSRLVAQMHKAITMIQFKLEYQIIRRRKEFGMEDRNLLHLIDKSRGVITIDGKDYPLRDRDLQTLDPENPYELTPEEKVVIEKLTHNFESSASLAKHMQLLYSHGALYLVRNSNLLYHGSVPLNEDGSFKSLEVQGKEYAGKALFDKIDQVVRQAYFDTEHSAAKQYGQDFIWYLWCGPVSPPFDKNRMATFERYFLSDKEVQKEHKGWYNVLKNNKEICEKILKEFGVEGEPSHIINGHIPVKTSKGESPIKAGGKLLMIDGGYSKAYQQETGIAGYTLIYNSYGLRLVQHESFESTQKAIEEGKDIISETKVVEFLDKRKLVRDTDMGKQLKLQIDDLKQLLVAFRKGLIR
ncbi:MAG: fructose-1,6-bisphosphatase [Bacteroidales bacterium]|nr:fructose-1,6-bisphosphatase [Bacteroidales bacterium]